VIFIRSRGFINVTELVITAFYVSTVKRAEIKVKGKVVPAIFLAEHHAMKAYWGEEV
jgi:hypothetical protein